MVSAYNTLDSDAAPYKLFRKAPELLRMSPPKLAVSNEPNILPSTFKQTVSSAGQVQDTRHCSELRPAPNISVSNAVMQKMENRISNQLRDISVQLLKIPPSIKPYIVDFKFCVFYSHKRKKEMQLDFEVFNPGVMPTQPQIHLSDPPDLVPALPPPLAPPWLHHSIYLGLLELSSLFPICTGDGTWNQMSQHFKISMSRKDSNSAEISVAILFVRYFLCVPMVISLVIAVLSRGISMLVNEGLLSLVAGPRGTFVPSHVLYADDVMIFCRGIKQKVHIINDNCQWLHGKGDKINFWTDLWLNNPMVDHLAIPVDKHHLLQAQDVHVPNFRMEDKLVWKHTNNGELCFRDAYLFQKPPLNETYWAKLIWSPSIPPSKSLLVWRLFHKKVPTDENLCARGCYVVSQCNLCGKAVETSQHLFWDCAFAKNLWTWLASTVNIAIDTSSIDAVLNICKKSWSPQCKTVITAAIVNLIDVIWFCRNKMRFDNKIISWKSASNMVISNTSLAGNHSSGSSFSD
ncbi:hypothetical protein TSUD_415190, partial [Trifolium subterraneum]